MTIEIKESAETQRGATKSEEPLKNADSPAAKVPTLEDVAAKAKGGEKLTAEEEEILAGGGPDTTLEEGDPGEEEEPGEDVENEPKKEEPATGAKKEEQPPKKTQTPKEAAERRTLIDAEIEKVDGQEDLSKFTPTEIGLYWSLKKERRRRQQVEGENRLHRFEKTKEKLRGQHEEEPAGTEEEAGEDDPFKDFEPDAVITVDEAREALKKKAKPAAQAKKTGQVQYTTEDVRREMADARLRFEHKGIADFDDVISYATVLTKEDAAIIAETVTKGGNGAEKTYWLIKGSPRWNEIEEALAKEKEAKTGKKVEVDPVNADRGRRAKQNSEKTRTTGDGSASAAELGEYSIEEILAMSHRDFGALPAKVQDKILATFGSEPNFNT